ncbi:MAG: pilus assembly protein TadG-related protein [Acidobacteria bacterium]|nr:pilus assembly protein TadG-related protein [Acidobacteriota bacterium]
MRCTVASLASVRSGQRGAVLIQVAVAMLGLTAFSVLVLDYGVMWAARSQAQNAADAGALAAAVSLAYYDAEDIPRAQAAAVAAGRANLVWGQAPDINPAVDVIIPYACPPGAPGPPDTCVRVNVYRNASKDPLPVFFAPLLGISSQGVQAMAVAQVLMTNASDCVKPFAIPDKWTERRAANGAVREIDWDTTQTFDRYVEKGPNMGQLLSADQSTLDEYVPPVGDNPGSGFTLPESYGLKVVLKFGNPHQTYSPGWYFPVDLPRTGGGPLTGGDRFRENIATCNGVPIAPGDPIQNEPGGMTGPTKMGIEELVAPDPSHWDETAGDDHKGAPVCDGSPGCFTRRIVAIPVFDIDAFSRADRTDQQGRFTFTIVKLLGFFINNISSSGDVTGYFMAYPGVFKEGSPDPQPSSFLRTVALVR